MNREERRNLEKQGVSKETIDKLSAYDKPCTVLEVVKLSRAIAEDVTTGALDEFRRLSSSTILALTLQVELLKKIVMEQGMITEEEFQKRYEEEAKIFEEKQKEYLKSMQEISETPNTTSVSMSSSSEADLELTIERK